MVLYKLLVSSSHPHKHPSVSRNEAHEAQSLIEDCDDCNQWMFQHLATVQPRSPVASDVLEAINHWSLAHREIIREIVDLDPTLAFRMHNIFCNVCGSVMYAVSNNTTRRIPSLTNIVIQDMTRLRDSLQVNILVTILRSSSIN